jgi:hypothetical protein
MEEKIKILENHVVGSGVHLGGCVFQSFEILHKWVQTKVPKGRLGLFIYCHSFLEFFTLSGHKDTEAGAAAFSHSMKADFTTYIVGHLVMNDMSYRIDSTIMKALHDHLEAQQLAIDCITVSKQFAIDLIAFMSQEYATWQQRGFTKKDAWQIVCQIVRRVFEDMQSAHILACNVQDLEDVDFTTASFLYVTLKCHEIMECYVKHQPLCAGWGDQGPESELVLSFYEEEFWILLMLQSLNKFQTC